MAKKSKTPSNNIAQNKRTYHDYFIEQKFEAGIVLDGWEVKSARMSRVQITDAYVYFRNHEAFVSGIEMMPLNTTSSHTLPEPKRTRKLLLNRRELNKLIISTEQKGYTVVCTSMFWKAHLIKVEIALAKGKQNHDKRDNEKSRDWGRQQQRLNRIK